MSIIRSNSVIYDLGKRFNTLDLLTWILDLACFFVVDFSDNICFAITVDSLIRVPYGITQATSGAGAGNSSAAAPPAGLEAVPDSISFFSSSPSPDTSSNDNCNSNV